MPDVFSRRSLFRAAVGAAVVNALPAAPAPQDTPERKRELAQAMLKGLQRAGLRGDSSDMSRLQGSVRESVTGQDIDKDGGRLHNVTVDPLFMQAFGYYSYQNVTGNSKYGSPVPRVNDTTMEKRAAAGLNSFVGNVVGHGVDGVRLVPGSQPSGRFDLQLHTGASDFSVDPAVEIGNIELDGPVRDTSFAGLKPGTVRVERNAVPDNVSFKGLETELFTMSSGGQNLDLSGLRVKRNLVIENSGEENGLYFANMTGSEAGTITLRGYYYGCEMGGLKADQMAVGDLKFQNSDVPPQIPADMMKNGTVQADNSFIFTPGVKSDPELAGQLRAKGNVLDVDGVTARLSQFGPDGSSAVPGPTAYITRLKAGRILQESPQGERTLEGAVKLFDQKFPDFATTLPADLRPAALFSQIYTELRQ